MLGNALWDDWNNPGFVDSMAEIDVTGGAGAEQPEKKLTERIVERLDLLKWALATATDMGNPPGEGTCLILSRLGGRAAKFRRDERLSVGAVSLDAGRIALCKEAIAGFAAFASDKPDIYRALWHFGRSCVAALDRDALLEAAIGLDALAVPGGGDARYRFRLHGAALLSTLDGKSGATYEVLGRIYDERSRAAHGRGSKDLARLAGTARQALADAILAVVRLGLRGEIDAKAKGSTAEAVERYVIGRATGPNVSAIAGGGPRGSGLQGRLATLG